MCINSLLFLCRVKVAGRDSVAPYFPIDTLKAHVMSALKEAVVKGAAHIRDPIGGSNANLFVWVLLLHLLSANYFGKKNMNWISKFHKYFINKI